MVWNANQCKETVLVEIDYEQKCKKQMQAPKLIINGKTP